MTLAVAVACVVLWAVAVGGWQRAVQHVFRIPEPGDRRGDDGVP